MCSYTATCAPVQKIFPEESVPLDAICPGSHWKLTYEITLTFLRPGVPENEPIYMYIHTDRQTKR